VSYLTKSVCMSRYLSACLINVFVSSNSFVILLMCASENTEAFSELSVQDFKIYAMVLNFFSADLSVSALCIHLLFR